MKRLVFFVCICLLFSDIALAKWVPPTRYAGNPVMSHGGGGYKDSQVYDEVIIPDPTDSSKLIMYYSTMAAPVATGLQTISRATADVSAPYTWTEYASNPILSPSVSGWDHSNIRCDDMIYESGTYYLFYSGASGGYWGMGLATSTDGINFTKYAGNPTITASGNGRNDGDSVSQGTVLKDGSTYYLYYSYRNGGTVLPGIRVASSTDKVTWTKQGSGDIFSVGGNGQPDAIYMEFHNARIMYGRDGTKYYTIVYEAYNGVTWSENIAYSTNPTSGWKKSLNNPVFSKGAAGQWDQNWVATPSFVKIGSLWYLFYSGAADSPGNYNFSHWDMGIATFSAGQGPIDAFTGSEIKGAKLYHAKIA